MPSAPAVEAAAVGKPTTYKSAMAIHMNIASWKVRTAENIRIRGAHHHGPAVIASAHITDASRQARHQRDPQANFDSVDPTTGLNHACLLF
jgi:hypothetical protein